MYTVGLDYIKLAFFNLLIICFSLSSYYMINTSSFIYNFFNKEDKVINIPEIYNEKEIEQVIFGSLLGDGLLEKQARSKNPRFCLTQFMSQFEYFIFV